MVTVAAILPFYNLTKVAIMHQFISNLVWHMTFRGTRILPSLVSMEPMVAAHGGGKIFSACVFSFFTESRPVETGESFVVTHDGSKRGIELPDQNSSPQTLKMSHNGTIVMTTFPKYNKIYES